MRLTEGAKRALHNLYGFSKFILGEIVGIAHSLEYHSDKLSSDDVVASIEEIHESLTFLLEVVEEMETALGIGLQFVNAGERPDENEKSSEF